MGIGIEKLRKIMREIDRKLKHQSPQELKELIWNDVIWNRTLTDEELATLTKEDSREVREWYYTIFPDAKKRVENLEKSKGK